MQNPKDIDIPSKNRQTKESTPPRHRHTVKKKQTEENKTPRHRHTPKKQIETDSENQTNSQTSFLKTIHKLTLKPR